MSIIFDKAKLLELVGEAEKIIARSERKVNEIKVNENGIYVTYGEEYYLESNQVPSSEKRFMEKLLGNS